MRKLCMCRLGKHEDLSCHFIFLPVLPPTVCALCWLIKINLGFFHFPASPVRCFQRGLYFASVFYMWYGRCFTCSLAKPNLQQGNVFQLSWTKTLTLLEFHCNSSLCSEVWPGQFCVICIERPLFFDWVSLPFWTSFIWLCKPRGNHSCPQKDVGIAVKWWERHHERK